MGYWDFFPRYEPRTPKRVKDGLRTRKQAGEIGETWWAKRFLSVLEKFGWSNRLARGRSYARQGQVIDCKIKPGLITSKVQGTRKQPYNVRITVKTLKSNEWEKVIRAMSSQARFSAKLLSGQMPQDIEDAFKETKVPLFPESEKDFVSSCSCPDWANPCKHIAAVYYIVAEFFDRDPFLIFELRGMGKDELLNALHKEGGILRKDVDFQDIKDEKGERVEPLANDPKVFWKTGKKVDYRFSLKLPPLNAAVLHRLGVPKFFMGTEKEFYKTMEKVYSNASKYALELAYFTTITNGSNSK